MIYLDLQKHTLQYEKTNNNLIPINLEVDYIDNLELEKVKWLIEFLVNYILTHKDENINT